MKNLIDEGYNAIALSNLYNGVQKLLKKKYHFNYHSLNLSIDKSCIIFHRGKVGRKI